MRDAFARVLEKEMEQNERIVLITGDLGFGVLRRIHERFPNRLINAGIAEQSMVSLAAGLATTGRTVLVYSIGNFPVLRPLEQIPSAIFRCCARWNRSGTTAYTTTRT